MTICKCASPARWLVVILIGSAQTASASVTESAPAISNEGASDPVNDAIPTSSLFRLVEHQHHPLEPPSPGPQTATPLSIRTLSVAKAKPVSSVARERVLASIRAAEVRHRIPTGLLDALVAIESGYRPFAVSPVGAAGLAQLMPGTAKDLGVIDRFDPRANLDGGARYLRAMLDRFGSVALALAAYNAGPNAVARSRGIPRNGETPTYVSRVIARWQELIGRIG